MTVRSPQPGARPHGGRRGVRSPGLGAAVLSLAAGAGLAAVAAGQGWLHARVAGSVGAPVGGSRLATAAGVAGATVAGSVAVPLALAAGLVGLAGAGALLAVAGRARRLLGMLLALAAAGAVVATVAAVARPGATYAAARPEIGPVSGAEVTAWPFVALLGLLLMAAAGVLTATAGGTWPALGRRYERSPGPGGRRAPRASPTGPAADWDDLDAGLDPTVDRAPAPGRVPRGPRADGAPEGAPRADSDSVAAPGVANGATPRSAVGGDNGRAAGAEQR